MVPGNNPADFVVFGLKIWPQNLVSRFKKIGLHMRWLGLSILGAMFVGPAAIYGNIVADILAQKRNSDIYPIGIFRGGLFNNVCGFVAISLFLSLPKEKTLQRLPYAIFYATSFPVLYSAFIVLVCSSELLESISPESFSVIFGLTIFLFVISYIKLFSGYLKKQSDDENQQAENERTTSNKGVNGNAYSAVEVPNYDELKRCIFCYELIQKQAIKRRFCGEMV